MYTRAQGVDFDSFETEGWYAKDMLPLANKLETFHPKGEGFDQSKHGHDGPIHISDGGFRSKSTEIFCDTVKGMGYGIIDDLQDFDAVGGFSVSLSFCLFGDGKWVLIMQIEMASLCRTRW
jgi:alcohol oxidase